MFCKSTFTLPSWYAMEIVTSEAHLPLLPWSRRHHHAMLFVTPWQSDWTDLVHISSGIASVTAWWSYDDDTSVCYWAARTTRQQSLRRLIGNSSAMTQSYPACTVDDQSRRLTARRTSLSGESEPCASAGWAIAHWQPLQLPRFFKGQFRTAQASWGRTKRQRRLKGCGVGVSPSPLRESSGQGAVPPFQKKNWFWVSIWWVLVHSAGW